MFSRRAVASLRRQLGPSHHRLLVRNQIRLASSQPSSASHTTFYKTFGRPIAKVFLMAILTYQLTYLAWMKLEQDDIKDRTQAEIAALEEQVKSAQAASSAKSKR